MGCHAGELTNERDGELWICSDHALETMSRDHEEGYMLRGDRGDRVGSVTEQGHLTQQVALDEGVQDPLLSVDATPRLDRALMDQIGFALRLIAFPEDHISGLECLGWQVFDRLSHGPPRCSIQLSYRRVPTFYGMAKGAGSRKRRRTFRVRRAMLLS